MNSYQIETEIDDDEYEQFLNEMYGDINVCGMTMSSGYVLKHMDTIAFDIGKSEYETSLDNDNPKYGCGQCHEPYDDEDEAENCCKTPCETCGELYEDEGDAEVCCTIPCGICGTDHDTEEEAMSCCDDGEPTEEDDEIKD